MVFHYPFRLDDEIVFSTHFIIQDLEVHQHTMVLELLQYGVVSEQSVFVAVILEGSGNDIFGVTTIRNNYIFISTAQEDRKAASIISINFF